MNNTLLAVTVLLGLEDELWFEHQRDEYLWELYLWTRRN